MNKYTWLRSLFLMLCWATMRALSPAQTINAGIVPPISTNLVGSAVTLSVTQNVQGVLFDYQWAKDGINLVDDAQVSGSLTPTLSISNLQFTSTGNYSVTLSQTGVVLAAASSVVYVVDQPIIQSVVPVTTGGSITFTATATGGLLAYQWTWQGRPIGGATSSVLVFNNAYNDASAGFYSVNVTNPVGATTWSGGGFLFTKPTPSGTYQGLFYDTNSVMPESSGFFQYTLSASKRAFSGKILLGANRYSFSGAFSTAHDADVEVQRPNDTPLSLQLQLVTTNDAPQVIGSVTDGAWVAGLRGNRLYFNSKITNALAGKYTLSLLNTNVEPQIPSGSGYGTVNVNKTGTVAISGQAGDGTSISQSCGLSRAGEWPFYVSMFKGRGRLIGWLKVFNGNNESIHGDAVAWVKLPGPDKLYPDGFANVILQPTGSTYSRTSPPFSFANAVAAFTGGDLFSNNFAIWDFVKVLIPGPYSFVAEQGTENLKLSVNSGNGVMSGQFIDVITGLKAPIKSVVLQKQKYARGYFVSTNSSGSFTLTRGSP